ncbi:pyridoxal-phosphate dependent enzyme [Caldisphaera sp.]|uniref:pyridoxal-phosphate dependent enzyme n=1 Tax=Caldisphaera sp. TaxID=2060322 RepID=UPI003D0E3301
MKSENYKFKCIKCGYETEKETFFCPKCGGLMQIVYDDFKWIVNSNTPSIWRYRYMLPRSWKIITMNEGLTPIKRINGILSKLETNNPTGVYTDRASSLLLSLFNHNFIETIYEEDFTISLSHYARKAGVKLKVKVIPDQADPQDLIIIARLGSEILFTEKNDKYGLVYENPYTIEGLKTISYEIYETKPKIDKIYVPAQSGILVYAIAKGFQELKEIRNDFKEYEIIAVKLRYANLPDILNYSKYKIKISEVSSKDALESIIDLSKKGLNLKPLASVAYSMAKIESDGIAIITGKRRIYMSDAIKYTELRKDIINLFSDNKKRTAYEIWNDLGKYSLKGVYKSLIMMVNSGELCEDFMLKGQRKIKVYWKCND